MQFLQDLLSYSKQQSRSSTMVVTCEPVIVKCEPVNLLASDPLRNEATTSKHGLGLVD